MIEAYPLSWPIGYKRNNSRVDSRFKQGAEKSQKLLRDELQRLGATHVVVSSNVMTRNDGMMYVDMSQSAIADPGVAIYFKYKGKEVSMCCDKYRRPWENVCALANAIEGLRTIQRHEVSEFLDRAFTGFKALPHVTNSVGWWKILEVPEDADENSIVAAYRRLSKKFHPDNSETGDAEKFIQVKSAYEFAINNKK